jgi:hypothetical protein
VRQPRGEGTRGIVGRREVVRSDDRNPILEAAAGTIPRPAHPPVLSGDSRQR